MRKESSLANRRRSGRKSTKMLIRFLQRLSMRSGSSLMMMVTACSILMRLQHSSSTLLARWERPPSIQKRTSSNASINLPRVVKDTSRSQRCWFSSRKWQAYTQRMMRTLSSSWQGLPLMKKRHSLVETSQLLLRPQSKLHSLHRNETGQSDLTL